MRFTKNQVLIMQYVADGLTDKGIALKKKRSSYTVKRTLETIRIKLNVQDRLQMAVRAFCLGLVK